jgi:hypothetical protein
VLGQRNSTTDCYSFAKRVGVSADAAVTARTYATYTAIKLATGT